MKNDMPESHRHVAPARAMVTGTLILLAAATIASAADPAPGAAKEEPKKKNWDCALTLGATLTRGNSKNFLASGVVDAKRTWAHDEALLGASAGYGENTTTVNGTKVDTTTDSYIRGYGQWNHLFSPQAYAGVRVTGDHDDIASLTYRTTVSPLAGYYLVKQTNAFLAGEIGPSYVREKFFSQEVKDYLGLRLGERGERKFASGARIWETVGWIPKVEDFSAYLLNAEAGVSAPITRALSVSLILQDIYNSVPATGKLKNDLKLIAGLTYRF